MEERGLLFAGIAFLITLIGILVLVVPYNGILRNPETHEILKSPFMDSIVVIIAIIFLIPGIAYGIGERTIKNDKMEETIDPLRHCRHVMCSDTGRLRHIRQPDSQ